MSELNDEDLYLVNKILHDFSEWRLADQEVGRLAKVRDEAIARYNEAVNLRDKLPRPTDREVELLKQLASSTAHSLLNDAATDVKNNARFKIELKDQSKGLRYSNININDVWMKELFGQNIRTIRSDGIIFFDKDKDCVVCKIVDCRWRPATIIRVQHNELGVVVYTGNEHRWFAICNTLDALKNALEEMVTRK